MQKRYLLIAYVLLVGCSSLYYGTWERFGKEKRDLLRDTVLAARSEQKDTGRELQDALTQLRETYRIAPSKLEKTYDKLKGHYEELSEHYRDLNRRISKMQRIATDLFNEWRQEAASMANREFRRRSLEQLSATEGRYRHMRSALLQSQERCRTVLGQFKEYVLFLKHNLNAQAVGGLQGEADDIMAGLSVLIEQMNTSIAQTDVFIRALESR